VVVELDRLYAFDVGVLEVMPDKNDYVRFFFQAEDGIRDFHVTGVQTCALPISRSVHHRRQIHRRLLVHDREAPPGLMNEAAIRILLVEDNPGDARLLRELLRDADSLAFEMTHVQRLADGIARVAGEGTDVVLLDLSLPDAHGMETVERMLGAAPEAPIIVLTGLNDQTTAVRA